MTDYDKRDFERIDLLGKLRAEVMVFQPAAVRQISLGGIRVETSFPLHLDSLHDFRLAIGDRAVVVKGRVVHSHISEVDSDIVVYLSGIEFVEPSDQVLAAINDFIDQLRQARPE